MEFIKKLIDTIIEVEKKFIEQPKTGAEKKQIVIEIINKAVDIPVIPEFIEKKILDVAIDLVVYIFNKYKLFNNT